MTDLKTLGYKAMVLEDVIPVSELIDYWTAIQEERAQTNDPYVKIEIDAEVKAIEKFFYDLGYGTAQEIADEPNGDAYNETLISEPYFVSYARELLEDCGDVPRGLPWYVAIDWERTANNIKTDYVEADFPLDAQDPEGPKTAFHMRGF